LEALQHVGSEMNTESTGGFTQANDAVNCKWSHLDFDSWRLLCSPWRVPSNLPRNKWKTFLFRFIKSVEGEIAINQYSICRQMNEKVSGLQRKSNLKSRLAFELSQKLKNGFSEFFPRLVTTTWKRKLFSLSEKLNYPSI
jgi:hypothetical protein